MCKYNKHKNPTNPLQKCKSHYEVFPSQSIIDEEFVFENDSAKPLKMTVGSVVRLCDNLSTVTHLDMLIRTGPVKASP